MTLPSSVPVLKPEMICQCRFEDGEKACLLRWKGRAGLRGKIRLRDYLPPGWRSAMDFNDDNPLDMVADFWNRTMEKLGYVRDPSGSHFHLQGREGM